MKLINVHKKVAKEKAKIEPVPFKVTCAFGDGFYLDTDGTYVCVGEDYVSVEDAREAVAWVAEQLGGKVEWGPRK